MLKVTSSSSLLGYWLPGYKLEKSWAMGIHVCVMYNAVETALVLLQKGAAVNQMPNGKTPLHVACEVSNGDCVPLLLAHGAKVNSLSLSGHTPLHYCITWESVECAKQLILKGEKAKVEAQIQSLQKPLKQQPNVFFPLMEVQKSTKQATTTQRTHLYTRQPDSVFRSWWLSIWLMEHL